MSTKTIQKNTQALRALAHPMRLRILGYIQQNGETPVTPIYHSLRLEQSVVSQQLRIMRQAGLVTNRRNGKQIFYRVSAPAIQNTMDTMAKMIGIKG